MTTVRDTKRADELKEGEWIAPATVSSLAAEVLHVLTYPHPGASGLARTHLVLRELGVSLPFDETFDADHTVELATEAELAELREQSGRAKKIADLRALADFLDRNPWMPLPYQFRGQHGMHGDPATDIAKVRALAERVGVKVEADLDDRTVMNFHVGDHELCVVAWHEGGRPAELTSAVTERGLVDETGPVHMAYVSGDTACGLPGNAVRRPPLALSLLWRDVTCQACLDEMTKAA